jgi:hypothetical protein
MATNLAINESLLETARTIGRLKTKKETVNLALEEFINRRKITEVISLFNTIDYDETYDYKQLRSKR